MKHTDYSKPMPRRWDPETVFEIENSSTGYPTCVGQAVTYGRRCKRVVAGHRVSSANCIAHGLAELSASAAARDDKLYDIAHHMLCYQHGHQAEELVSKWRRELRRCGSESETENIKLPRFQAGRLPTEEDIQNLYEGIKKLQEELRRMKEAKQTRSRKSSPLNNASAEYSSEEAETDTEETDKTKEDLREKEKRKAKDRAEKAKEEARRSAQAAKLAEEQKWSNAWSLYNDAWHNIELGRSKKCPLVVPWPTLSGRAKDVNEASVREFFQRASGGKTEDFFLLFSQEAKRWHTDKLLSRFGKDFVNGADKENIDLVTRVIVQRWKEAKRSRAK